MTGMQAPICTNWLPLDYSLLSHKLKSHGTTIWKNHFVGKVRARWPRRVRTLLSASEYAPSRSDSKCSPILHTLTASNFPDCRDILGTNIARSANNSQFIRSGL
jgi:hypothetical protein